MLKLNTHSSLKSTEHISTLILVKNIKQNTHILCFHHNSYSFISIFFCIPSIRIMQGDIYYGNEEIQSRFHGSLLRKSHKEASCKGHWP